MSKKDKAKTHQKRKAQKTMRARQKKNATSQKPNKLPRQFSLAVEHLANISFKYLSEGINYHFTTEGAEGSADDFVSSKGLGYPSFSCGVRGVLSGVKLEVSKPLTWVPKKAIPLVRDYLAELWNEELVRTRQLNSFTFFLTEDADEMKTLESMSNNIISSDDLEEDVDDLFSDEEEEEAETPISEEEEFAELLAESEASSEEESEEEKEDEKIFLAMSVITSGVKKEYVDAYLVLRRVSFVDGKVDLSGANLFLDIKDIFNLHVPAMVDEPSSKEVQETESMGEGLDDEQVPS